MMQREGQLITEGSQVDRREWLQGELLAGQLTYWKQQLAHAPTILELPTARSLPQAPTYRRARQAIALSAHLTDALRALSRQEEVSLFMTLLAVFQTLLHRYTGQDDFLIGTLAKGHERPELHRLLGYFNNRLVLRADMSGNPTFRELLGRVRQVASEAYAHQDVPFGYLVEELRPERTPGRHPFFQVLLTLETPKPAMPPGWGLAEMDAQHATAEFDLSLELSDQAEGVSGHLEYSTDLFDEATIARMIGHWQTLLAGIVADPGQRLSALPLLTERECQQLLVEWNATQRGYPGDRCIHQMFEAQVGRTPEAEAVVFEQKQVTYRELNQRANQLAHCLHQLGVGPEVLVGLCVERSLDMMVGLLGILKAGGAYVPLDPTYPTERLAFMLQDAQVTVLLTQQHSLERLPQHEARVICLDSEWQAIAQHSAENLAGSATGKNLAYLLYTSGSTGKPKGVTVEHWQLFSYTHAILERLDVAPGSSFAMVQPLTVDSCLTTIFPPLTTGGCLHVISSERSVDSSALAEYFRRHTIDCLKIAPSHLAALHASSHAEQLMPRQRLIIGGEASRWDWVCSLQALAPNCIIFNHYGPTEATVGVLTYEVKQEQVERGYATTPLGRPLANTQIYLLDAHMQPVPIGVPGELYIGGANVARGYLNRPDLTAQKFIPDPFSVEPGARLYSTGDLAHYLPDGNIEFLGRIDDQVKIRGLRIELGEIEAVLNDHPAVQQALVVTREDVPGDKRLVTYVVPQPQQMPTVGDLRGYLRAKLPDYMVPSAFILLEALPLTPHGKVDRRALPAPDYSRSGLEGFVAPRTPLEEMVATTWSQVLGIERVGIHDDFFALGGHSLLAMQITSRLRAMLQVEVPLRSFFKASTAARLAEVITQMKASGPVVHMPALYRRSREAYRVPASSMSTAQGSVSSRTQQGEE